MTEAEWLACEDPGSRSDETRLNNPLSGLVIALPCVRVRLRTLRLHFAAYLREASRYLPAVPFPRIEEVEADAERESDPPPCLGPDGANEQVRLLLREATCMEALVLKWLGRAAAAGVATEVGEPERAALRRATATLRRDIFGNPFRPAAFSPSWRTDTAVTLARIMYDSRDFSAMPILADALQDAGCDSDDILNHCRGDGTHVRGCWVVDLVLGKE
jgi:hypothetical protein